MISFIFFIINLIFLLFIFFVKLRKSMSEAFLNAGLIILVFVIGWTISTSFSRIILPAEGFGENFTTDDFSLVLLTVAELFFYIIYYKNLFSEDDKEK